MTIHIAHAVTISEWKAGCNQKQLVPILAIMRLLESIELTVAKTLN